jgi:3-phosphoshikimate 1-carboxyvinyltransferase
MRGLTCLPCPDAFRLQAEAPPSKAHTLRAVFLASLADGLSILHRPLPGTDQRMAVSAVARLGAAYTWAPGRLELHGGGWFEAGSPLVLDAGDSGLSARVLLALAGLRRGGAGVDGGPRLRDGRPVADLLAALAALGMDVRELGHPGHLPVMVTPPLRPPSSDCRHVRLSSPDSSQPLTALLLAAPLLPGGLEIELAGPLPSRPYIEITLELMKTFGVEPEVTGHCFRVPPGVYRPRELAIEGDWSGAAFFFAAAALTGGSAAVSGLDPASRQGDRVFVDLLAAMGCRVETGPTGVTVSGRPDRVLEADMGDCPDLVPALAVVMARTPGAHRVTGAAHLRVKESNRLQVVAGNLRRLGVAVNETPDGLEIQGRDSFDPGAVIETFRDHRIAMAFALAGLVTQDVTVDDPACVAKSFPGFWDAFSPDPYHR